MKKNTYIGGIILSLVIGLVCLGVVFTKGKDEVAEEVIIQDETPVVVSKDNLISYEFDDKYQDESWDDAIATHIHLDGTSANVSGDGVNVVGNTIQIRTEGTYVLQGTSQDLQVHVNASDSDEVRLILNGVDMSHTSSAPLYIENAKETLVTVAKGTINSLSDASEYLQTNEKGEPSATVFSNDDLILNGSGTLNILGNAKNGIQSDDDLVIIDGTYGIQASNDGIKGKDSVAIQKGTFTINASGDGIQSSNDTDVDKGWLYLKEGEYFIESQGDAIQAERNLQIDGGEYNLVTLNNSDNSSNKGIKASADLMINGGYLDINTIDDAIHSNANVTINQGTYLIHTGDDGVHADGELVINNGTITIQSSYEGIEGSQVTINDGILSIVASDDGINSAGGNDTQEIQGRHVDLFQSGGDYSIVINGGSITIDAEGDGIDANGNLDINGGVVSVFGPTNGGNGYLDYDGTAAISAGTLFASGTSDMMQGMSEDSTQASIALVLNQRAKASSFIEIRDSNETLLLSQEVLKDFNAFIFSSPELKQNDTVHISIDGVETLSVTLSSMMTTVGENGESIQMGMGPQGDRNPDRQQGGPRR